jgi:predicted AAA+ superfamily ATPase
LKKSMGLQKGRAKIQYFRRLTNGSGGKRPEKLKGIYDTEEIPPALVVTGSARLDTYRKVGNSLAGRFFQFRLHPLDLKEIRTFLNPGNLDDACNRLLTLGGLLAKWKNWETVILSGLMRAPGHVFYN